MLNPSVDVQRAITRLLRPSSADSSTANELQTRSLAAARQVRAGLGSALGSATLPRLTHRRGRDQAHRIARHTPILAFRPSAPPVRAWIAAARASGRSLRRADLYAIVRVPALFHRLGHERSVAVAAAGIVLAASVLSVSPDADATAVNGDTGGPVSDGAAPRIAIGGPVDGPASGTVTEAYVPAPALTGLARFGEAAPAPATPAQAVEGNFLEDGTLLKPVAVDTSVADGSDLVRTYRVKSGDTLSGIAKKFGVSMKTLYWANDLKDRHELHLGQRLEIPPVSGLVVEVSASDTLASLSKKYKVSEKKILKTNGLDDRNLVVGQVLVLPGAKGEPLPTPKPKPAKKAAAKASGGGGGGGGGGSSRPPKAYTGGRFSWPAPGGGISQYYHYGHYGIDIDGSTGDRIQAAAGGTVTFAGWKNNGGGYQVWIAHGSGLYTTYNHMSSVAVGRGQHVGRGQRVGRMGATGFASGSHLHFEVWKGPIWNGGRRVNPLGYLR